MYQKVKLLCEQQNISVSYLEKSLEFSTGSICKWSKSTPSADKLQKVSKYFNVPISYFLEESEG